MTTYIIIFLKKNHKTHVTQLQTKLKNSDKITPLYSNKTLVSFFVSYDNRSAHSKLASSLSMSVWNLGQCLEPRQLSTIKV